MASFTFEVESRPSGKVTVNVWGEADYPDAAQDLANRARDLHRQAVADVVELYAFTSEQAAGDGE